MKIVKEFKEFISRGNVMDLAVGVIMGSAFTAIVNSLVKDMLMPILSMLTGGIDFSSLSVVLGSNEFAAKLNYGAFISAIINFLLVAAAIFCMVKGINKISRRKDADNPPPTKKVCPFCKEDIAIDATRCPRCTSILKEE